MRRTAMLLTLTVAATFLSAAAASSEGDAPNQTKFELIKQLEGEWLQLDENGQPTETVGSIFKVSAAGTVVLETLFPGTDHEMLTIYHQDGSDVVLTHYCVLGNQPHMKLVATDDPHMLLFRCIGGTNFNCQRDPHMHEGRITVTDGSHLTAEWHKYENGRRTYTAAFELVRKK